jgi:hypothetical protein
MFTDDEWKALSEAPLRITLALVAVGAHGPISVVKEAAAGARAIARPPEHGPADDLIAEIARDAERHEARHDVQAHAGKSVDEIADQALSDLGPANRALDKLSADEAAEVRAWMLDIAKAVASAAKSITPSEQQALDRLNAIFAASS